MRRIITVVLGFVRENALESSTRLVMVLLCVTGCVVAIGTLVFAFKHPEQAGMVMALNATLGALIASGCVAIAQRTRKGGEPGDGGPQS